jgi:DNA modification methylase
VISVENIDYETIAIDDTWNFGDNEALMHSVHAYPAKFPAFIASKAFEYAKNEGVNVNVVSDVFCGCGTVALEARIHGKDFWGCDINPVATLIAKAKSREYKEMELKKYLDKIVTEINMIEVSDDIYIKANERLQYWYTKESYSELYKLKISIDNCVPKGKYNTFFLCVFSSILKASSRWLTKSIKPQIDPNKKQCNVNKIFHIQFNKMLRAVRDLNDLESKSKIIIKNQNILTSRQLPKVDLIITSPPYVTSYEYADLHQLSTLWLGYTKDYKNLREGSIGSVYNSEKFSFDLSLLNSIGQNIINELLKDGKVNSKVKSVARYYLDMQNVIIQCKKMLNENGMAFFVVGDTEYKGVKILNSEHLIEALRENGFHDIKISKRRISNKILTPYRDENGKFTSDKTKRTIYHEEWIISGRM